MLNWIPVTGSRRVVAEAYEPETETIYVRFPNGVVWRYRECPPDIWDAFRAPGQSRGRFIDHVLNNKPNGRIV